MSEKKTIHLTFGINPRKPLLSKSHILIDLNYFLNTYFDSNPTVLDDETLAKLRKFNDEWTNECIKNACSVDMDDEQALFVLHAMYEILRVCKKKT